jgi:hypothetical protein
MWGLFPESNLISVGNSFFKKKKGKKKKKKERELRFLSRGENQFKNAIVPASAFHGE